MIDLRHVSFSYDRAVLRDISLHFEAGHLYAVVGPNGSGKTTLLRLLAGLNTADRGTTHLCGRPYEAWRRRALARQVSFLPQARPVPELTAAECVALGRFPHSGAQRTEADRRAVSAAMTATDTTALSARRLTGLSGGERQRVYLAMLLAQDTPVLLLDEPTGGLDPRHQFMLMDILHRAQQQGKCVITVLHDLPLALRCCDRMVVLSEGQVQFAGLPTQALADGVLDRVFGVRCIPAAQGGPGACVVGPAEK